MAQHRRKIRHGRPKKANARRRATTAAGRQAPDDHGSPELLAHRARATGSILLPDDVLGVLHGRGVLDLDAYTAGRDFAALVRLVRLGLGLTEASAAGTWRTILAATSRGQPVFDFNYPGADRARRALDRFRRDMGHTSWRAVSATVDNVWPSVDNFGGFVIDLRQGLAYLANRLPLGIKSL